MLRRDPSDPHYEGTRADGKSPSPQRHPERDRRHDEYAH